jgi:hypothetical protein
LIDYIPLHSELAYQVCDGYAVSNDWFTIYPHISGAFESPHDAADPEKHKVGYFADSL